MDSKIEENSSVINRAKVTDNASNPPNNINKKDIKADNYNKSKIFELRLHNLRADLSRVDSQIDPDVTANLDYIAKKMGLDQSNNDNTSKKIMEIEPEKYSSEKIDDSRDESSCCIINSKSIEEHKKNNFMSKIIRRLSKPSFFSKDKKIPKVKESSKNLKSSFKSENKSNLLNDYTNNDNSQQKSYMKMFNKFKKRKSKNDVLDHSGSIDSRPSVSSAVNQISNADSVGSHNEDNICCRSSLIKCNSPSVDCLLDERRSRLLRKQDSVSSDSEDHRSHEIKMDTSNSKVVSIFYDDKGPSERTHVEKSEIMDNENKLNTVSTFPSFAINGDTTHLSNMSDSSSNVKLSLFLHGYSKYDLSSSRFNSKSCMEFRTDLNLSMDERSINNLTVFNESIDSSKLNDCQRASDLVNDSIRDLLTKDTFKTNEVEVNTISDGPELVLHISDRPDEIQLRKCRGISQSSITRSSLIMVAVAHNTPRSRGSTLEYHPESPVCFKKIEFEDQNQSIEEEHINVNDLEKDGYYFLQIAKAYEEELSGKISIVQGYLDASNITMNDEVIGELNTAVGLAKLLLKEKFVQFRGLCHQNLNETGENEFKTLSCDLEGFLKTLELQVVDLDKNFQKIENIKDNNWEVPLLNLLCTSFSSNKKSANIKTSKFVPVNDKRSLEAKSRIAKFKKISTQNNNVSNNFFALY